MIRSVLALVLVLSAASLSSPAALAWGQPDHAVLGLHVVQQHGAQLPSFLTSGDTRRTFILANYSPDYFVLQGPHYVHLDRNFPIFMIAHSRDNRGLAYAYGWGAHQEEDEVGHGRYIVEKGMPHLYKEIVMGARLMYQGSPEERELCKKAASVWDARLINLASKDYRAKYGHQYREISEAEANTVGYAFGAYLAGLKAVQWALWYGRLKRHPEIYPRSDWAKYQAEAVEQCRKWAIEPMAFSNVSDDAEKRKLFANIFAEGDDALPPAAPFETIDSTDTKTRIRKAVQAMAQVAPGMRAKDSGPTPGGHDLMQNPEFLDICDNMLDAKGVQFSEAVSGDARQIEVYVAEDQDTLQALQKAVEAPGGKKGIWPAFAAAQNEMREMLKGIVKEAVEAKD